MKKLPYIYSLLLFCICFTTIAQEVKIDSIPKLDGILHMKVAEIDSQTGEQLYYTVVEVPFTEGLTIASVSASTTIKANNKWREQFTFYDPESLTSSNLPRFYIKDNTLSFELGLYPEKHKIKVTLYDTEQNPYRVKLQKLKSKKQ